MSSIATIPNSSAITGSMVLTTSGWTDRTTLATVNIDTGGITLLENGDIYQMSSGNKVSDGVFDRLERIERMMGILRRDKMLENTYEPLREAGDKYDAVLDHAIADIMNIAINTMKQHADDYERLKNEAKVYHALTKDSDQCPRP